MRLLATSSIVLAFAPWAIAQPHAADIVAKDVAGRVVTGRVEGGTPVFPRYVFTSTLGLIGVPNATFDPGVDSENGAFQPSIQVGLSMRKALRIWDGQGFATIPDERVATTKNSTTITTPATDPPNCQRAGDLLLGLTNSSGRIHQHPAYELLAPAETGIYMVELEVWMNQPGQGISLPVFVLLNQNDTQQSLDAAFRWAEANLPSPACYSNCDNSTTPPVLNVNDFVCFLNAFASGKCSANCDGSTTPPALNVNDFVCFQNRFAAGCP